MVKTTSVYTSSLDGVLADTDSSGNTITSDTMHGNSAYDAQDNSSGSGTAGTANTWTDDDCFTSSPPGLCASSTTTAGVRQDGPVRTARPRPGRIHPAR